MRDQLIIEVNRRTGVPASILRDEPESALTELLATTQHESLVEASEARPLLDPGEMPRVFDFIDNGCPEKRSLLVGSVGSDEFIDSFLVLDNPDSRVLVSNGRSLRSVIETIRQMGGLESAASQVPWLQKCLPLARHLDWTRLSTDSMMFVRRASAEEAASSLCKGQGTYIEEGQHRAIAAAWNLTGGSAGTSAQQHVPRGGEQLISYLRGVNRLGHERGPDFWDVGMRRAPFSTLQCAGALVVCGVLRWMFKSRRRRSRRTTRAASSKCISTSTRAGNNPVK